MMVNKSSFEWFWITLNSLMYTVPRVDVKHFQNEHLVLSNLFFTSECGVRTELLLFWIYAVTYIDCFFRKKMWSSLVFNLQKLLQDTLVNIRSKMLGKRDTVLVWSVHVCTCRLTFKCLKFVSFTAQHIL